MRAALLLVLGCVQRWLVLRGAGLDQGSAASSQCTATSPSFHRDQMFLDLLLKEPHPSHGG